MSLPLVVVPGSLEDKASWQRSLADIGDTLQVIENIGAPIGEMSARLLDRFPPSFALLGHSLGGYVAMEAALAAPGRVAALTFVSTSARAELEIARAARRELVRAAQQDFERVVARLSRAALACANRVTSASEVEVMMRAGGYARFAREQAVARSRPTFADRIDRLACATLVITGSEDTIVLSMASNELAAAIPGARLIRFMGCGHMPQLERQIAFSSIIRSELKTLRTA